MHFILQWAVPLGRTLSAQSADEKVVTSSSEFQQANQTGSKQGEPNKGMMRRQSCSLSKKFMQWSGSGTTPNDGGVARSGT